MVKNQMNPDDPAFIEERKKLYLYWHDLPFIKSIDTMKQFIDMESGIKGFILKYIRDGVEDDFSREHNLCRRHAFTAKELNNAFKKESKLQKNYSSANFHFHLKSLIEDGFVQEIAKILEGRHYRTYYGRTAKTFSKTEDNILSSEMRDIFFDSFKNFIKEQNSDLEFSYINELVEENIRLLQDFYFRIISWIKDKYPYFYNSRTDLLLLVNIVGSYSLFHEELAENLKKIGDLIGLNQIMKYKIIETQIEEEK